jgi:hypothetical protein
VALPRRRIVNVALFATLTGEVALDSDDSEEEEPALDDFA